MTRFVYDKLGGGRGRFASVAAAPLHFLQCGHLIVLLICVVLVNPARAGDGASGVGRRRSCDRRHRGDRRQRVRRRQEKRGRSHRDAAVPAEGDQPPATTSR
eukprot:1135522-Prorocentrum_minimum.AAC.2